MALTASGMTVGSTSRPAIRWDFGLDMSEGKWGRDLRGGIVLEFPFDWCYGPPSCPYLPPHPHLRSARPP